jgi:hypothetical protein
MNLKRVINLELSKDEKGDLLADPNKIVNRRMNYFCQVFRLAGGGGGIRQTKIQTAEPFVPEPSTSEVEVAIGNLKGVSRQVIRFQLN